MPDDTTVTTEPAAPETPSEAVPTAPAEQTPSSVEAGTSGEAPSTDDASSEGAPSTSAPASSDSSSPAPAPTPEPDPEPEPEPTSKYQVGDLVAHTVYWPAPSVQVGQVLDVRDSDGAVSVGWFSGVSGPIEPDNPDLQAI